MKKQKTAKYLKPVFLLFTISILLWNCEKESSEIIPQNQPGISLKKVKKQFYASFNKEAFSTLPSPQWDKTKVFYDDTGNSYLEIPFQTIHGQDIGKGTSVSFDKLIAFSKDNAIELAIVHYFGIDIAKNYVDFKELSHKELYNFSGFVTRYDLNKNVIDIKRYNKGIDTNQRIRIKDNSKHDDLLSKVDENTWEYTETICTRGCWYWEYENGRVEVISCTQWECTTTTYTGSNGNSGGGGNGNGTRTSYNTNKRTKCANGYKRNTDGKCVKIPYQIFNKLTGKDKCIYEKLKELALFKSTIQKFEGNSNYDLTIDYGNCKNTNTGCTDGSDVDNGKIKITMEITSGSLPLDFAASLLHEGIHAEIFKYVNEYKKGIDPNKRKNLLYHYFQQKQIQKPLLVNSTAQHQHMADKFVKPIAEAIRALDNNNYPLDYYLGFGWDGLRRFGYDGYYDNGNWVNLNKDQSTDYYKKQKIVNDNTKLKNNECN